MYGKGSGFIVKCLLTTQYLSAPDKTVRRYFLKNRYAPKRAKSENCDNAFSRNLQVCWYEKTEFPKSFVSRHSRLHSENLSCFRFKKLVLKKPKHSRVAILWLLACVVYGLLFLSYEKSATRWAKTFNGQQKRYSVINVIKRVIADVWHPGYLLSFFRDPRCRGDTRFDIY